MDLKQLRNTVSREKLKAERKRLAGELRRLNREHKSLQRKMSAYDPRHECHYTCCGQPEYHSIHSKLLVNRNAHSVAKLRHNHLEAFHRSVFRGHNIWLSVDVTKWLAKEFAVSPLEELARAADD